MDVAAWLRDLGLGQYESRFRESEIDADVLPELTEADLEKLGLPLGPRKRILKAIQIWVKRRRRRELKALHFRQRMWRDLIPRICGM
jgi:hypothetical protein